MKNLLIFILKAVIIAVITMTCVNHVLCNLQVQHVDIKTGKITNVYNIVECYNILDSSK